MTGRHDSLALINCDANGCGGALGQLHTAIKPLSLIEQITRDANKTPEQLRDDMDWHRQGQADANARANDIDRQIADLQPHSEALRCGTTIRAALLSRPSRQWMQDVAANL